MKKLQLPYNWLLPLSLILIVACSPEKKFTDNGLIDGLASVITLQPDTTVVYLDDFVNDITKVDTIYPPAGMVATRKENKVYLTGIAENKIDHLQIVSEQSTFAIPVKKADKKKVVFTYNKPANKVHVKGEFNAWNVEAGTFNKNENGFEISFAVQPGNYQYVYVVDGKEIRDPLNPDSVENGLGGFNSLLRITKPNPDSLPKLSTKSFTDFNVVLAVSLPINNVRVYWQNFLVDVNNTVKSEISFTIPKEALTLQRSYIRAWVSNKQGISNEILIPLANGKVVSTASQLTRQDKHAQILYFMMIDRFKNGNPSNDKPVADKSIHPKANYFGGDIAGVTQKVKDGYFEQLGINTLWLSPITQNPEGAYGKYTNPNTTFSGYHGYWPVSLRKIDYRFGNENELKELLNEAHNRNMNVILDYVAHHVHNEHPLVKQKPEWFTPLYLPDGTINTERWDDQRLTTWFDVFLPTLDLRKPEVVNPMTDTAIYWVQQYELDGFRHDASKHIDLLFWRTLTKKVKDQLRKQTDRSLYQIGETYGSRELVASYVNSGMLDGQFDFNLYDDAVATFARNDVSFSRLLTSMDESLSYFGDHHLMGNVTGNQDRARFISYADGSVRFDEDAKRAGWTRTISVTDTIAYKKLQLLTAFMLVSPGVPVIYYGDEIGDAGGNDPDNRRQMRFDNLNTHENATRQSASYFINLRKKHLALIYGNWQVLYQTNNQVVISRKYFDDQVIIAFNKAADPATINIEKNPVLNKEISGFVSGNSLSLSPYSVQVFTSEK
ncbi:MAG: alpha-amylase family glycosyl hydrolase [Chryseotalea sp.]|jgi:cyclomaltodextrinase